VSAPPCDAPTALQAIFVAFFWLEKKTRPTKLRA